MKVGISLFCCFKNPYEYINNWEKFSKTFLPNIEKVYSNLNLESISNSDCNHGKSVFVIIMIHICKVIFFID